MCVHSYLLEDWVKFGYAGRLGRLDHCLIMLQVQFATEVTLIRLLDYACIILIEDAIG